MSRGERWLEASGGRCSSERTRLRPACGHCVFLHHKVIKTAVFSHRSLSRFISQIVAGAGIIEITAVIWFHSHACCLQTITGINFTEHVSLLFACAEVRSAVSKDGYSRALFRAVLISVAAWQRLASLQSHSALAGKQIWKGWKLSHSDFRCWNWKTVLYLYSLDF